MNKKLNGILWSYEFGNGRWRVSPQHSCGSCGLTEEEQEAVDNYNGGVKTCLPVMEQMEARILELEEFLALGNILPE